VFAITGAQKTLHVINEKRCVECGVCGRICPAKAITDAQGVVCVAQKRSEWKKPRVDTVLCSACGICVADCTAGALRISQPQFRGDIDVNAELSAPQKCVACELCERHCPLGAITMEAAS
jgi:formate hydrogenlyase subunit 6/NADH:ubiquinone oxidoreductase subunit I